MEFVYVGDECDMQIREPLYWSGRGRHGGHDGGVAAEHMTQEARLAAMTCEFCGRLMWGFRVIQEEP